MRVEDLLHDSAPLLDGRPVLVDGDKQLTFAEIDTMSSRMAAALAAHGIRRGGRVLVFLDNGWEAIVAILAIIRAGAAFTPVDPSATAEALAALVNESHATALVTQARLVRATATAMAASPELRFIVIAGCEGSPGIDGIMRFEDAVAGPAALPDSHSGAEIEGEADGMTAPTTLGRCFDNFVAAACRGATFVLEKSEGLLDAAE
jgi:acyl-CoA synthetase (AMP-forming)/AMP-acid ligase II